MHRVSILKHLGIFMNVVPREKEKETWREREIYKDNVVEKKVQETQK